MENTTIDIARAKYLSYDPKLWHHAYFDAVSGGFNVYHKDHYFSKTSGGGNAEKAVGIILANLSKQVEFLPEGQAKKPDICFDNATWDIKYINQANENVIRKHILDARKADNAIFYWDTEISRLEALKSAIMRELGNMQRLNRTDELPDVYYIDINKLLVALWKK
jgi:hypothetical protein